MRVKTMAAAALAAGLVAALPTSATAFDFDRAPVAPEGYHAPRPIHHWIYKPRYNHVYHVSGSADPYAYRYAKRAYYPYYGSRYWVSAESMRYRYRYHYDGPKYVYQPSWGRPKGDGHHEHHAPSRPTK